MAEKTYRISQIKLRPGEPESALPKKLAAKLKKNPGAFHDIRIVKRSIDARDKRDVHWVLTLEFRTSLRLSIPPYEEKRYQIPAPGSEPLPARPVIAGFGPCGMFCGLILAKAGYRPLILERGSSVDERVRKVERFWKEGILDPECNVQFGEGGAGTFSDGKLTTGIKDPRVPEVLRIFADCGADPDILIDQKPHIGTDVLRTVVRNIREEILALGGEIRFDTRLEEVTIQEGRIREVIVIGPRGPEKISADALVLALGHSARDSFSMLHGAGLPMEQKPFSIGVRIEHDQAMIDRAQYGEAAGSGFFPPAVYKLSCHTASGRGVYTFCMCPGGEIVNASSAEEQAVTNGMSLHGRDSGKANSAVLVDVRLSDLGSDDPLAGVRFQETYEKLAWQNGCGRLPETVWKEFRDKAPGADAVRASLPPFAVQALEEGIPLLGRKLKGFDSDDARMVAVESRSSSPVRLLRGSGMESEVQGIYPGGEGAGYAGGIVSAAVDGMKIAETIIRKYKAEY